MLATLTSASAQRTYNHAIDEFVDWYCSEPRLAFNRTVVLRYRIHLEEKRLAPSTINLRLAAVRRVAYEAAGSGLLSPELARGHSPRQRRAPPGRAARQLAHGRPGQESPRRFEEKTLRGRRDRAMVAMLLGCGLRRAELLSVTVKATVKTMRQREDHWVIADLIGKGGHIRTVPIPGCVKTADAAGVSEAMFSGRSMEADWCGAMA